MLERNFLSHLKLVLLLSLLSWSVLLQARLVPEKPENRSNTGGLPLSAVGYGAAMACLAAGCWEYYQGYWDLRRSTPFLRATNLHLTIMSVVAAVVFGVCIVLLVKD